MAKWVVIIFYDSDFAL